MVVDVFGVSRDGLLEERRSVFAAARSGNSLIVDYFGQGQTCRVESEGVFCFHVFAGIEEGKPAIEICFERVGIVFSQMAKRRGCKLEVLVRKVGFAQSQPRRVKVRAEPNGLAKMADAPIGRILG